MMPVGTIVEYLYDILSAHSEPRKQKRIWAQLNYQYFELCRQYSWAGLRCAPVTLDFTGADSTGLWLPSDLYGIDLVWDSDNEQEFYRMDRAAAQPTEGNGYRYYTYEYSRSHLFEGTDIVLAKGASTFTSAALTAWLAADATRTVAGEYVQFDDEPGYYLISNNASPFAFTPTYYGEQKANNGFRIRPWQSSKKLVIIDPDEDKLYDRSVDVYYWRAPVALYRLEDVSELPSLEVLKLRTLRALPQSRTIFGVSQTMMDAALKEALKLNERFRRPSDARDAHNRPLALDKNPYGSRAGPARNTPAIWRY